MFNIQWHILGGGGGGGGQCHIPTNVFCHLYNKILFYVEESGEYILLPHPQMDSLDLPLICAYFFIN